MSLSQTQLMLTRFYLAAFNRAPDLTSLDKWTLELDKGGSFKDLLMKIWSDPDVQALYPDSASNQDFISKAYLTLFERSPGINDEGHTYWTDKLTNNEHRSAVLYDIVTAGLNIADGTVGKAFVVNRETSAQHATEQQLDSGTNLSAGTLTSIMAQVDENPATIATAATRTDLACDPKPTLTANQLAVCRIYLALFNRAPELEGLNYWTAELNGGKSVEEVVNTIYEFPLVKSLFATSVSNKDFVIQCYQDLFNRSNVGSNDIDGVNYWTAALDSNLSRGSLRLAMVDAGGYVPDGTDGKALITNRVESSQYASLSQLSSGIQISDTKLVDFMSRINDAHSSVDSVAVGIDAMIADGSGAPLIVVGQNESLTVA